MDVINDQKIWYSDQLITTYSLLYHKLCNVPATSDLWNFLNLTNDKFLSDENICWHGTQNGFIDCNKEREMKDCGGKWWHFFPQQDFEEHIIKFHQITNNSVPIN